MTKIITMLLAMMMILSACHRPERMMTNASHDSQMSCEHIKTERERAEQAKLQARSHDQFELRYILILPAIVSLWNFHKAEEAAEQRAASLNQLYEQKNCHQAPVPIAPQAAPSLPYSNPNNPYLYQPRW